jgi:hypothetical protein
VQRRASRYRRRYDLSGKRTCRHLCEFFSTPDRVRTPPRILREKTQIHKVVAQFPAQLLVKVPNRQARRPPSEIPIWPG